MLERDNSKPIKEFRVGVVSAAIWKNHTERYGEPRESYSITFQRRYRDETTGQWETASTYTPHSLAGLLIVARKAQEYCLLVESEDTDERAPL
jgi:hypothetical protein